MRIIGLAIFLPHASTGLAPVSRESTHGFRSHEQQWTPLQLKSLALVLFWSNPEHGFASNVQRLSNGFASSGLTSKHRTGVDRSHMSVTDPRDSQHQSLAASTSRRSALWAGAATAAAFSLGESALAAGTPSIGERVASGGRLPLTVGYGTCLIAPSKTQKCVTDAIDAGYRLFDTAQRYGNEEGVGKAIKSAIASKKFKRDEVFVTTKVWVDNMGFDRTIQSVRESAAKLGNLDGGIDLVLIHWPGEFIRKSDGPEALASNQQLRKETWAALEKLKADGVVKEIGVSNFGERHFKELLGFAKIKPAVNQFEVHPFNQRKKLIDLCKANGVTVEAYSPLGGKGNEKSVTDELLSNPDLTKIASAKSKTAAEVILRWHLQRGVTPIPKSSTPARIKENFDVFGFDLTEAEMAAIAKLDRGQFAILDAEMLA